MSTDVYIVKEDDLVEDVMRIMFYNKVHTVPVANKSGKMIGVISSIDLVSACF